MRGAHLTSPTTGEGAAAAGLSEIVANTEPGNASGGGGSGGGGGGGAVRTIQGHAAGAGDFTASGAAASQ